MSGSQCQAPCGQITLVTCLAGARLCEELRHVLGTEVRPTFGREVGNHHLHPAGTSDSAWWREELEGNAIGIPERDPGTVVCVLDSSVRNPQLVQSRCPPLQVAAVGAREGDMVETGPMLVELVVRTLRMRVQPEKLSSLEEEDCVVKAARCFVFIEHWLGVEQGGVPALASVKVGDCDGDVGDRRELSHAGLLNVGLMLVGTLLRSDGCS